MVPEAGEAVRGGAGEPLRGERVVASVCAVSVATARAGGAAAAAGGGDTTVGGGDVTGAGDRAPVAAAVGVDVPEPLSLGPVVAVTTGTARADAAGSAPLRAGSRLTRAGRALSPPNQASADVPAMPPTVSGKRSSWKTE
jgi:hypothetical protein